MAPINYIKELWRNEKGSFWLLQFTTLICVFLDPVYGLVAGMVVALLRDAAGTALAESRLTALAGDKPIGQNSDGNVLSDVDLGKDAHPGFQMSRQSNADEGSTVEAVVKVDGDENSSSGARTTVYPSKEFDASMKLADKASPIMRLIGMLTQSATQEKSESSAGVSETSCAVLLYEPIGPIVYLAADRHQARLNALIKQRPEAIVVSMEFVTRVDVDGSMALGKSISHIQKAGISVQVVHPDSLQSDVLSKACWLQKLRVENRVFAQRADALREHSLAKCHAVETAEIWV
jgi:MFS superfamily sulfate permease-like transporter